MNHDDDEITKRTMIMALTINCWISVTYLEITKQTTLLYKLYSNPCLE
jgi:hypothetical protein